MQRETENNLMIGIILRLANGTGNWGSEPPLLCSIEDQGQVVAVATQTPPYNLVLTRMDEAAIASLISHIRTTGRTPPGILGPVAAVNLFGAAWTNETGQRLVHEVGLGIYQLDKVIPPEPTYGFAEIASTSDESVVFEWLAEFGAELKIEHRSSEDSDRQGIIDQQFWLWKTSHTVSLARAGNPTPHGIRIGPVYTPPMYRGKGYATANVAALSQHLLDNGRSFCYLFADLANPTSTGIYQKIGYERISEFESYRFVSEG
jgi:GNAT superfamily N-acetyltransferase